MREESVLQRQSHFPLVLQVLLVAAVLPYVVGLGDSTIWDANEAFYAETARGMVESGDYVNPSFNGRPRFNKPVLSYWAVASSYRLFGVSERSERLPIAAAALVLMVTAFLLGGLAGSRGAEARFDLHAALLAALALATAPRFLMFARRIIIDVWIAMFMGLTLLFFVLAETRGGTSSRWGRRQWYLLAMYVAAGLGVLTKGPVAVVLPALAFLIYLAVERRLGDLRRLMIPTGVLIVAAIVLPWYVALYAQHGWVYIWEFFIDENLMRYARPVGPPGRGPWFYVPVLLTDLFPWSLLLPVALVSAWAGFRGRSPADRARRLLFIWIATIVVFFSFSRTKQDLYVFPIVPAEAALIGMTLAASLRGTLAAGVRRSLFAIGAALSVVGLGLLMFVVVPGALQLAGSAAVACLAVVGGGLLTVYAWQRRTMHGVVILVSTFTVLSWIFVLLTLPDFEQYKPVAPLVEVVKQRVGTESRTGTYRFGVPSMTFYLRRPVFVLEDEESLKQVFASGDDVHCLMTAEDYRAIKDSLAGQTYVIATRPLLDVRVRSFLDGTARPEIVLVSNRP